MGLSKVFAIIAIAALAHSTQSASIRTEDCKCTREYIPICASDNSTYSNDCMFGCEKERNGELEIRFYGECDEAIEMMDIEADLCVCTDEYYPVCGSDDKTYPNECMLKCEKMKRTELKLKHEGECDYHILPEPNCACTDEYVPVCGSDDKTYSNECMLKCEKLKKIELKLKHEGECEYHTLPEPNCACTDEYFPVCGTDNQTYSNECLLKCEKLQKIDLKLQYYGECKQAEDVHILPIPFPLEEDCFCVASFEPVCGSDEHTYSNECRLNCEMLKKSDLRLKHYGQCLTQDEKCICTRVFAPICAKNLKNQNEETFSNECTFNCAQKRDPHLIMQYQGECKNFHILPIEN